MKTTVIQPHKLSLGVNSINANTPDGGSGLDD